MKVHIRKDGAAILDGINVTIQRDKIHNIRVRGGPLIARIKVTNGRLELENIQLVFDGQCLTSEQLHELCGLGKPNGT